MSLDYESLFAAIRLVMHFATFLILARFRAGPDTRYRPGVSLAAVAIAGSSLALVVQILTNWHAANIPGTTQAFATVYASAVLAAVVYSKGNVARLIDPLTQVRP